MKPGRELDKIIAEKVMGWTEIIEVTLPHIHEPSLQGIRPGERASQTGYKPKFQIPHYSTESRDANLVIDKMEELDFMEFRCKCLPDGPYQWIFMQYEKDAGGTRQEAVGDGITRPHAICMAALKAIDL